MPRALSNLHPACVLPTSDSGMALQWLWYMIVAVLSIIYTSIRFVDPIFQVYKAPSSRRSSISSRHERETSLSRREPWEMVVSGRDSMRSNRSVRSERNSRPKLVSRADENSARRSKRSNRGSTRSRTKSPSGRSTTAQNGSLKARPNNLPWMPTIALSSGVDSDVPRDLRTSAGMPRSQPEPTRGHENESYGYGSSSDNPYSDYLQQRTPNGISPGPPPGPAPAANKHFRPTNLAQSFNSVADLPPPLDEGPEAYSRDSIAFPAPPPPLADGPEPYRSTVKQNSYNAPASDHTTAAAARGNRPTLLTLEPMTPTKEALSSVSSPSSPGSSSISTEKSGAMSVLTAGRTLENNLDQRSPFNNLQRELGAATSAEAHHRQLGSNVKPPFTIDKLAIQRHSMASSVEDARQPSRPLSEIEHSSHQSQQQRQPSVPQQHHHSHQHSEALSNPVYANANLQLRKDSPADTHRLQPGLSMPSYKDRGGTRAVNGLTTSDNYERVPSSTSNGDTRRIDEQRLSPTADLRQVRSRGSEPKDNTFMRMVTGNLSHRSARHAKDQIPLVQQNNLHNQQGQPIHQQPTHSPIRPPLQQQHQAAQQQRPAAVPLGAYKPQYNVSQQQQDINNGPSHHAPSMGMAQVAPAHSSSDRQTIPGGRSAISNAEMFNGHRNPPMHNAALQMPTTGRYQPHSLPPWEKNEHVYDINNSNDSRNAPTNNHKLPANHTPSSRSGLKPSGTLTEVTSSYGGLYSSRENAAIPSRRRNNPRGDPGQGHGSYQSTNITDDVKTTKGAFVSSQPSVI